MQVLILKAVSTLIIAVGLCLLSAAMVNAQEAQEAPVAQNEQQAASSDAEPTIKATETNDSETASEQDEATPEQPPQSAALKERKLGDAFRRFQPSEEISADNAVPFPVDI